MNLEIVSHLYQLRFFLTKFLLIVANKQPCFVNSNKFAMETGSSISRTLSKGLGLRLKFAKRHSFKHPSLEDNEHSQQPSRGIENISKGDDRHGHVDLKGHNQQEEDESRKDDYTKVDRLSTLSTSETMHGSQFSEDLCRQGGDHKIAISYENTPINIEKERPLTQPKKLEEVYPENIEERLNELREYFNNRPLMSCLDTAKEIEEFNNLLYENLSAEVKEIGPQRQESRTANYRGIVQIRAY